MAAELQAIIIPQFKVFHAEAHRFFIAYDPSLYTDVRPSRSDFLSCITKVPDPFPIDGLSYYDVDFASLPEPSSVLNLTGVSNAVGDGVLKPSASGAKIYCPNGSGVATHFYEKANDPANPGSAQYLHNTNYHHLCISYDLYPVSIGDASVTPLLEMFPDLSRPLVQVQCLFQLNFGNHEISSLDAFKTALAAAVQSVVDRPLIDDLNEAPGETHDITVVDSYHYNCTASWAKATELLTKLDRISSSSFYKWHRKHFQPSDKPLVTSIIMSRNLGIEVYDTLHENDLFPSQRAINIHRYYTQSSASHLQSVIVGKFVRRGHVSTRAFYITSLKNNPCLQTEIAGVEGANLTSNGHFRWYKTAVNGRQTGSSRTNNFVVAFAWTPPPPAGVAHSPLYTIMNNDFFCTLQIEANVHFGPSLSEVDKTASTVDDFLTAVGELIYSTLSDADNKHFGMAIKGVTDFAKSQLR